MDTQNTFTVKQVADILGCNAATVRRHAINLGLGTKITERMRLLSSDDIAKIKAVIHDGPGQPRKKPLSE